MISKFFKNFQLNDYANNEINTTSNKNGKIIDCSLGTNAFIDSKDLREKLSSIIYDINSYPSYSEYNSLKNTLCDFWYKKTFVTLNLNNISFSTGTRSILKIINSFFLDKNCLVLGYSPQFSRYVSEVKLKEANYIDYKLSFENNYKFIVNDFIKYIDRQYDLIYIDNPNNPTGQIISIEDIELIANLAKKYNTYVVIDEAYGDYMDDSNSAISLANKYTNIIILRSATKFYGLANLGIGYIVANEEIIELFDKANIMFPISDFACKAFAYSIQNDNLISHTKQLVQENKKKLISSLDSKNFLYTDFRTPIFTIYSTKYDHLANKLIEYNVISESCEGFDNLNSKYTRIRIPKEIDSLIMVLKKVL